MPEKLLTDVQNALNKNSNILSSKSSNSINKCNKYNDINNTTRHTSKIVCSNEKKTAKLHEEKKRKSRERHRTTKTRRRIESEN